MAFFRKRERVYENEGDRNAWRAAQETLKQACISIIEASSYESELPLCSCGAKIDHRNYGPKGWIDRRIYYIAVRPEDAQAARELLAGA